MKLVKETSLLGREMYFGGNGNGYFFLIFGGNGFDSDLETFLPNI